MEWQKTKYQRMPLMMFHLLNYSYVNIRCGITTYKVISVGHDNSGFCRCTAIYYLIQRGVEK